MAKSEKNKTKPTTSDIGSDGDLPPEGRAKLAKLKAELEAMHTAFVTYWGEAPFPLYDLHMLKGRWDGTKWPDPPLSPAKRWRLIKRFKRLNKLRDKTISKEAHEEAHHQAH
jgi:hypothetical protein